MFRKYSYYSVVFLCFFIIFTFNIVSADTGVNVLIYTGKIAVTAENSNTIAYVVPQELKTISSNSIVECLDGVAILEIGETKLFLEPTNKVQLLSNNKTGEIDIVSLSGDIRITKGDETYKIVKDQRIGSNSLSLNTIDTQPAIPGAVSDISTSRVKRDDPPLIDPAEEPDLTPASPYR